MLILLCVILLFNIIYILLCNIIVSIIKLWYLWRRSTILTFFGQNWHITEISVFDFGRNLISISINYDIYEEEIYVYIYSLYKVSMF